MKGDIGRMLRKGFRFFAMTSAVLAYLFLSGRAAQSIEGPGAAPVAKVNDRVLTVRELEEIIDELVPSQVFHRNMTPEKRATFIPQAMEALVERELLYQEAAKRGMKADSKRIKE